jgi:hypothetical protein
MAFAYGGDQYKDLWIASKAHYSNKLIDMLPRSHPLLSKIAGNNNVKAKALKGKRFVEPILARTVNNVQAIGYRDPIDTSYANLLEVIEVEPKLLYQGVTVNDKEISVNNADELVDLLSINHRAVREGFSRAFAKTLYGTGLEIVPNASNPFYQMNGIGYMISDNPYSEGLVVYNLLRGTSGDYHNNRPGGTQEFWRNRAGEFIISATSGQLDDNKWNEDDTESCARKLVQAMTMMLLTLNGVSEVSALEKMQPIIDGIYMNYKFYNIFQYAMFQLLHINNIAEQKVDMGFTKLEHMGVPVYLDKNCPMNKIYFIDSSQIDLLYVPGENFKQEVKEIPTEFAKRYITSFMGNYIIHKARNCGVITLNASTNGLPDYCNVCLPKGYQDYDYIDPYAEDPNGSSPDVIEDTGYSGSGVPAQDPKPIPPAPQKKKDK